MEQLKAYTCLNLTISGLHFISDVLLQENHSTINTVKKQQVTDIVHRT